MDDQLRIWEDEGGRANPVAEELMKEDELPETFQQQLDVVRDRQERAMRWHGEEFAPPDRHRPGVDEEGLPLNDSSVYVNMASKESAFVGGEHRRYLQRSADLNMLEKIHKNIDAPHGLVPKGDFQGEPQTNMEASKKQARR